MTTNGKWYHQTWTDGIHRRCFSVKPLKEVAFLKAKFFFCLAVFITVVFSTGCLEKVPLVITNGLENYNITCVYISRGTDSVWGTNHLQGTDILAPGKEAEVMVPPGIYDLQVTDEDGDTYTLQGIRAGTNGFYWTVTVNDIDTAVAVQYAGRCAVSITNSLLNRELNGIWLSPSSNSDWGNNHITGEVLYTGDTYTAYVTADTYDIYVEDNHGRTYTEWNAVVSSDGYNWSVYAKSRD
jgi:hypothetical protein